MPELLLYNIYLNFNGMNELFEKMLNLNSKQIHRLIDRLTQRDDDNYDEEKDNNK